MELGRIVGVLRRMNSYLTGSSMDLYFNGRELQIGSGFIVGKVRVDEEVDLGGRVVKVDLDTMERVFGKGRVNKVICDGGKVIVDKGEYEVEMGVSEERVVERDMVEEGEEVDVEKIMVRNGFDMSKLWKRSLVDLLDVVWIVDDRLLAMNPDYLMVGNLSENVEREFHISRWVYLFIEDILEEVMKVRNCENFVRIELTDGYVDIAKRVVSEINREVVVEVENMFTGKELWDFDRIVLEDFEGEVYLVEEDGRYGVEVRDKRYFVRSKRRGKDRKRKWYIEGKFLDYLMESDGVLVVDGIMKLQKGDVCMYIMAKERIWE